MEHIHNAIQSAAEHDAAGFREAIQAALADKITDALELKKISIASSMFANEDSSEEVEQETGSDEDV
jgi:hypothetical protein